MSKRKTPELSESSESSTRFCHVHIKTAKNTVTSLHNSDIYLWVTHFAAAAIRNTTPLRVLIVHNGGQILSAETIQRVRDRLRTRVFFKYSPFDLEFEGHGRVAACRWDGFGWNRAISGFEDIVICVCLDIDARLKKVIVEPMLFGERKTVVFVTASNSDSAEMPVLPDCIFVQRINAEMDEECRSRYDSKCKCSVESLCQVLRPPVLAATP